MYVGPPFDKSIHIELVAKFVIGENIFIKYVYALVIHIVIYYYLGIWFHFIYSYQIEFQLMLVLCASISRRREPK